MCGIAGIMDFGGAPVNPADIRAMCDAMVHRGPDDAGIIVRPGAGLGMRRLSIIDVEHGHQPIANEDGSVHVVANGEIYNFRELRRMLEGRGHRFRTGSDTEVIVHLYEEFGDGCVSHLRGMFGLAVWDARRRKLLLARDRLGIKPLYYTVAGSRLLFASELKCLLQLPDVERRLNWESVDHLFSFMTTPPADSIVEGVKKLEPGHVLLASPGREPLVRRYWDVQFEPDHSSTGPQLVERLRELLDESVRLHRVSDVPLGAFLSGGVDSGAIAAIMARQAPDNLNTFSIGFTDPKYDESGQARALAESLGARHRELVLEPDVATVLDDIAWHLDEPFGDSSAIPTYMVSKLAAEDVKVVLSGDGGDELFAGYDKYAVEGRERRLDAVPAALRGVFGRIGNALPDGAFGRRFLRHFALDGADRYIDAQMLFDRDDRRKLFKADALAVLEPDDIRGKLRGPDWLARLQYCDLHRYLPLDILTKVDRMSMAHSLEVRVPLLDHKLVEFAATIPQEWRMRGTDRKRLFREALRGILPDAVLDRPKRGFAVPLSAWFRGGLSSYMRDLLLSERSIGRGLFNAPYIEHVIAMNEGGRSQELQLWTLISFELWCRTFLDVPAVAVPPEAACAQQ